MKQVNFDVLGFSMKKAIVLTTGLLVLTACATPREQCEANVDGNIKALKEAIATSEANLERGYGLETDLEPKFYYGLCLGGDRIQTCLKQDLKRKSKPVAIDLDEERRKLDSAKGRLAQEERARGSKLSQCAAQYPDEA